MHSLLLLPCPRASSSLPPNKSATYSVPAPWSQRKECPNVTKRQLVGSGSELATEQFANGIFVPADEMALDVVLLGGSVFAQRALKGSLSGVGTQVNGELRRRLARLPAIRARVVREPAGRAERKLGGGPGVVTSEGRLGQVELRQGMGVGGPSTGVARCLLSETKGLMSTMPSLISPQTVSLSLSFSIPTYPPTAAFWVKTGAAHEIQHGPSSRDSSRTAPPVFPRISCAKRDTGPPYPLRNRGIPLVHNSKPKPTNNTPFNTFFVYTNLNIRRNPPPPKKTSISFTSVPKSLQ